jgi:thioredoxin reductase (NADPH)
MGNNNCLLELKMADDASEDDDDDDMSWLQGPPAGIPEMETIECDVAIIGGGPAGCTCALYTSRADLSTVILDKNEGVGALAITSHIANYPGVDRSMSGMELLKQMKNQAMEYGTRICDRAQVFMIEIQDEVKEGDEGSSEGGNPYNKIVYTPDYTVKARSLVLATGAMGRSMPYLPGEEKYLGQGVSYCATCDGAFYRGSEVAVYGATGEAIEEAMFLTKFASTVHWITPTDVVTQLDRLEKGSVSSEVSSMFDEGHLRELLSKSNVKHHNKARLREVDGDVSGVTGVKIMHVGASEEETIPVEGAFIYGSGGGSKPITDFLSGSGIELDDEGGVKTNDSMESTSNKGVFAIGDIRNTPYKQVVVAASDGCVAAMSIEKFLKGRKIIKVDWVHK